jgi:fucose permease
LLHASDLGLDIFTGYVPLYLVDVVGATPAQAALAVAVLSGSDIVASALLIPWLRHRGAIPLLRRSAILAGLAFGAWFAVPGFVGKILLLIVIGFCRAPWYPVMQGEAYASHPGRSSAVAALTSISGPIGAGMAWVIGWTAQQAGIGPALLIVLLSPIALAAFVPRRVKNVQ